MENRPGQVEFCIGYKRLPSSGECQKCLVSQPVFQDIYHADVPFVSPAVARPPSTVHIPTRVAASTTATPPLAWLAQSSPPAEIHLLNAYQHSWCWNHNIPQNTNHYWWPGSLCRQVVSSHGIEYAGEPGLYLSNCNLNNMVDILHTSWNEFSWLKTITFHWNLFVTVWLTIN